MFVIETEPKFTHTVKVSVPVDGGYEDQTLTARYRVLRTEEFNSLDLSTGAGHADFLRKAIISLDDIAGADKKPIPYSDALRDQLLSLNYVRQALSKAYFEAVSGARAGN
jgi:hypothetical protein